MLSCLEYFHELGYLHYDLKEDNIIMLTEPMKYKDNNLNFILIDFGLSIKIFDENNNYICKPEDSKKCGNYFYASLNALKGKKVGKKDDIINLIFIILHWIKSLPWNNLDYKKVTYKLDIIKAKENFDIKEAYSNYGEIISIFEDVNKLRENDTPKYKEYKKKLELYISNKKYTKAEFKGFDWELKIQDTYKYPGMKDKKIYEDKDIKNLFLGYPKIFIEKFCEKYKK